MTGSVPARGKTPSQPQYCEISLALKAGDEPKLLLQLKEERSSNEHTERRHGGKGCIAPSPLPALLYT